MSLERVFGPVPSRRLGRSLGVNNIPPKICSYSCSYCQLGNSLKLEIDRKNYYDPEELASEVKNKLEKSSEMNESIDYITIVPDGEPTLDLNLGKLIDIIKTNGVKTAVITNSTLLHRKDVRDDLKNADWVSVKVDTVNEAVWRKIDRPHRHILFSDFLKGIREFASDYSGKLVTETMLVKDCNDSPEIAEENADFISDLKPSISYISIPTRPPADKRVEMPEENAINRTFQIYCEKGLNTEYLIGYEGNDFAFTGDIEGDLLSITSVHPMRKDAVEEYLKKASGEFSVVDKLVNDKKLIVSDYRGESFYLRKLTS